MERGEEFDGLSIGSCLVDQHKMRPVGHSPWLGVSALGLLECFDAVSWAMVGAPGLETPSTVIPKTELLRLTVADQASFITSSNTRKMPDKIKTQK